MDGPLGVFIIMFHVRTINKTFWLTRYEYVGSDSYEMQNKTRHEVDVQRYQDIIIKTCGT